MRATLVLVVMAITGSTPPSLPQSPTTYGDVTAGMKCVQNSGGAMECDYRVGRSLHFGIVGIGKADGSIYIYAASFEGDYYAVMGLSHGCVIVRPGQASGQVRSLDLAFVSPRNGRVYESWQGCQGAK